MRKYELKGSIQYSNYGVAPLFRIQKIEPPQKNVQNGDYFSCYCYVSVVE